MCASHRAEGCVVVPGPGGPPAGMSLRHFACAALKADDEGSIPLPIGIWKSPPVPGSGKLGTPSDRMHSAYFSMPSRKPAWPALVLLGALLDAVVVTLATDGELEPLNPGNMTRGVQELDRHAASSYS
jgi:hypothetical protein